MRLSVEIDVDSENREIYEFNLFDLCFVFVKYTKQIKPKGKRSWKIISFWDKHMTRDSNILEPELSDVVRDLAIEKAKSLINIKTWDEFKK